MPDNEQLKERLRRIKHEAEETEGLLGNTRARVYGEAADTIERLEAELEQLKKTLEEWIQRTGRWEDRCNEADEELEKAKAKLATLEAQRERDAAALEEERQKRDHWYKVAAARDGVILDLQAQNRDAVQLLSILSADGRYFTDKPEELEKRADAALQHAQEQVSEEQ